MHTLRHAGHEVYVVGGAVRDILLEKEVLNWDFTTSATPEQIIQLFPDSFYHNVYGTVTVKIPRANDSEKDNPDTLPLTTYDLFEITPFRKEGKYFDSRHPSEIVWAKTLEEDLARRDFTINALAYDGEKIVDLFGGQADAQAKVIRAVGNPEIRFREDALRLLRAVRFAAQLGFLIEDATRAAILEHAPRILHISGERITGEFFKILLSPHPADGVLLLRNIGLLKYILPELDACFGVDQKTANRHHIYDVGTHCVMALKSCESPDVITRFATLIHDIGKHETYHKDAQDNITFYNHEVVGARMAQDIADRFRLSREQKEKLVRLVAYHMFVVSEEQTDNALRRFIRNVGKENLDEMFALRHADRLGGGARETSWRTEDYKRRIAGLLIEPFTVKDLKIDGHDVMEVLKIKPSRQVGDILDALFERVISKELANERLALLDELDKLKHGAK